MLKVVLDTNVLIDGSTDDYSYGRRIIDEVIAGYIEAFANKATLAENHLLAKRKISDEGYLARLEYFFEATETVPDITVSIVSDDQDDNKLIASAEAASADYLITADNHLLKLGSYKGIQIVRPSKFWHEYEEGSHRGWSKWLKDFIK